MVCLPQLGDYEWKEDAMDLLIAWDKDKHQNDHSSARAMYVQRLKVSSFLGTSHLVLGIPQIILLMLTVFDFGVPIVSSAR